MKHNSAKQSWVTRGGTSEILLSPFPSSSVVTLIDHIIIVTVVNIIVNVVNIIFNISINSAMAPSVMPFCQGCAKRRGNDPIMCLLSFDFSCFLPLLLGSLWNQDNYAGLFENRLNRLLTFAKTWECQSLTCGDLWNNDSSLTQTPYFQLSPSSRSGHFPFLDHHDNIIIVIFNITTMWVITTFLFLILAEVAVFNIHRFSGFKILRI